MRGFTARSASSPSPSRSMTPGRNDSTTASARAARRRNAAAPAGWRRSSATERFPRFSAWYASDCSPRSGGSQRSQSPPRGSSTFTTSAPRSARIHVANGPGRSRVRSRTRTPASGGATSEDLLQLEGEAHVALDLELAGHERHLRVQLPVDDREEVLIHGRHRALRARRGARLDLAARLGAVRGPRPPARPADVELVDGVDLRDDVRLGL